MASNQLLQIIQNLGKSAADGVGAVYKRTGQIWQWYTKFSVIFQ